MNATERFLSLGVRVYPARRRGISGATARSAPMAILVAAAPEIPRLRAG